MFDGLSVLRCGVLSGRGRLCLMLMVEDAYVWCLWLRLVVPGAYGRGCLCLESDLIMVPSASASLGNNYPIP